MHIQVTFKCEDFTPQGEEVGPVMVIDLDAREADPNVTARSMPYGYQPAWREKLGYQTLTQARAIAAQRGVTLTMT